MNSLLEGCLLIYMLVVFQDFLALRAGHMPAIRRPTVQCFR